MRTTGGFRRASRVVGSTALIGALALGLTATTVPAGAEVVTPEPTATVTPTPEPTTEAPAEEPADEPDAVAAANPPYGSSRPVVLETNFSRPLKSISSSGNSDFSLLNDLERLIKGSYWDPRTNTKRPYSVRKSNHVYISVSRMENSHRVGRELIKAAKNGVKVRMIHGVASQSKESRALQRALNSSKLRDSHFRICNKGKSNACLSSRKGAIMHSKILLVSSTFTRDNEPATNAIWSGSANLGGPSGERTYNNGMTVYNDKKLWVQTSRMWADMYAERNVNSNYLKYIKSHASKYGYSGATGDGYTKNYASYGMFYSNLANVTIYATPIFATPTNGKDPVLALLNRIKPDDQCRIRLQQNRFKYRRIAVAQKLVDLADKGCTVSAVSFRDDLHVNRAKHCKSWIRICKPILDTFKTANRHIEAAWAKPHDKTILVDAVLKPNKLNPEERLPSGGSWPSAGVRMKLVQAGSAALTGSNLVVSDEITTETTDAAVYDDYLQHWKAIWKSREIHVYPY